MKKTKKYEESRFLPVLRHCGKHLFTAIAGSLFPRHCGELFSTSLRGAFFHVIARSLNNVHFFD
jgi:hypothetical protein